MKKLLVPIAIAMLALTGCGQSADLSSNKAVNTNLQQNEQKQVGIGNAPPENLPVSVEDKNNPHFQANLKLPPAFPGERASAQEVWKWVNNLEKTYVRGMLVQQKSFTEEQKNVLDKWLSEFFGQELKNKRLTALEPVEGGYRITQYGKVYDYSPEDNMIQSVDKLNLKTLSGNLVLTADLTVYQDQKIQVVYTISQEQGKWKIVDYSFKIIP